jgi:hypothetical protein
MKLALAGGIRDHYFEQLKSERIVSPAMRAITHSGAQIQKLILNFDDTGSVPIHVFGPHSLNVKFWTPSLSALKTLKLQIQGWRMEVDDVSNIARFINASPSIISLYLSFNDPATPLILE